MKYKQMLITPWARKFLNKYWQSHPKKRAECLKKYGHDPITDERHYWIKGIAEKPHANVLRSIKVNNNTFNLDLARLWAAQETVQA
jgi:hypothetical protein